jgi:adenosylcobinamide kinase / adenosylcobinamide-phosphate guanylyltransferase
MAFVLLTGGARSGKSQLAVRMASEQEAPVVFLATGEGRDPEMDARIAEHRRERPARWRTVEEAVHLREAIESVSEEDCLIVDCLTLWTANAMEALGAAATEAQAAAAAAVAKHRRGTTVAVSNEVGLGIVPDNAVAREYRDLLGRVNALWAEAADRAYLVLAGRAVALSVPETVIEELT